VKGQVHIEDENVWLYTEYEGYDIRNIVCKALRRGKSSWNNPEYLARIIFSEMIRDHIDDTKDYGIGTRKHSGVEWSIEIGCQSQTVTITLWDRFLESKSFEDLISKDK
jgi:hypothetical protein